MARSLCKTNIRRALRESWRNDGTYEDVTDEWQACIRRNYPYLGIAPMAAYVVELWNWVTGTSIEFAVGGCTCMTEYVNYSTECLMRRLCEKKAA